MRRSLHAFILVVAVLVFGAGGAIAQQILVPMDLSQTNHLKAYGLAYFALTKGHQVDWLLNYKGGSFLMPAAEEIVLEARLRDVLFQPVSGADVAQIQAEIAANNMETVRLEKAPRVAIYVPTVKQPWDDAVMLALEYAQVPYTRVFD
ncbi:MAG TPA: asparagine synthetase B, partial [Candidatus Krumholzibacteria bacterium]